tara:strand:- start:4215 stop:5132 length:918 start_codon:yes stop_codon:yes gene_type:complete
MFIDSDFNGNSFGSFEEDMNSNFIGHNNIMQTVLANTDIGKSTASAWWSFVNDYGITPSTKQMKDAGCTGGVTNTGGFMAGSISNLLANTKCRWDRRVWEYGDDSAVTQAFDTKAKTKNSYDYGMAEMSNALNDAQSDVDADIPFGSDMTCAQYDQAINSLNGAMSDWNAASVTHKYDRDLRAAYLAAIANNISEISNYMDVRDCNGATSAIDTSQQAAQDALDAQQAAETAAAQSEAESAAAAQEAHERIEAQERANQLAIAQLENEAEENRLAAEEEKAALDKRNKMIMYGAGVVILLLILKK